MLVFLLILAGPLSKAHQRDPDFHLPSLYLLTVNLLSNPINNHLPRHPTNNLLPRHPTNNLNRKLPPMIKISNQHGRVPLNLLGVLNNGRCVSSLRLLQVDQPLPSCRSRRLYSLISPAFRTSTTAQELPHHSISNRQTRMQMTLHRSNIYSTTHPLAFTPKIT